MAEEKRDFASLTWLWGKPLKISTRVEISTPTVCPVW